jgi:DNA-binding LacI/PurR family transcriptional regulator
MENLSTALARNGLTFVVHPGNREDRPITEIWKAITPAAVIAFDEFSAADMAAMRSAGVALVVGLLGRVSHDQRELEVPQQLIGRRQVEHLAGAGHTRLGYACPDDARVQIFADPRLAGVREACSAGGLAGPAVETVALDARQAADAVRRWHAAGITGICAYNDEVALAVLAGARLLGLAVPAELAVIGVDDIPTARLAAPPLTTVTTDQTAIADRLTATVVAAVHGRDAPEAPPADLVRVVRRESA